VDFVPDEKFLIVEDEKEEVEDPEIAAAREKAEKARTDLLWAGKYRMVGVMLCF